MEGTVGRERMLCLCSIEIFTSDRICHRLVNVAKRLPDWRRQLNTQRTRFDVLAKLYFLLLLFASHTSWQSATKQQHKGNRQLRDRLSIDLIGIFFALLLVFLCFFSAVASDGVVWRRKERLLSQNIERKKKLTEQSAAADSSSTDDVCIWSSSRLYLLSFFFFSTWDSFVVDGSAER